MQFIYYYRTKDNVRQEGEIGAPSRDEAFAALRERGIRPIKLFAKDGSKANGEARGVRKRMVSLLLLVATGMAGLVAYWAGRSSPTPGADDVVVATPSGQVTFSIAQPLMRQRIPGDRRRIENHPTNLFRFAAEAYLARFAEPGRPFARPEPEMLERDVEACLATPIRIASNDFTEHVDLKRIVAGMKRELRAYIAGGGTVGAYAAELVKRQKMEIAYREKAEAHLQSLLDQKKASGGKGDAAQASSEHLAAAYAYWLKANASLQAMGIAPLSLPETLRNYQMSLDLDTEEGIPDLSPRSTIESAPVRVM